MCEDYEASEDSEMREMMWGMLLLDVCCYIYCGPCLVEYTQFNSIHTCQTQIDCSLAFKYLVLANMYELYMMYDPRKLQCVRK